MKTKTKTVIIIASVVIIAIIAVIIGIVITTSEGKSDSPQKLLDLGNHYLLELDYEQALVQFERVIEIDPKNPAGYIGAAKAYIGLGEKDKAIETLRKGLEATGDNEIKKMLEGLMGAGENDPSLTVTNIDTGGIGQDSVLSKVLRYDINGGLLYYEEIESDSNGIKTKKTSYSANGSIRSVSEYDLNGDVIKSTEYYPDGKIRSQNEYEYEYDSNGNIVKETVLDSYTIEYEYDSSGNKIKETQYLSIGKLNYTKEYDSNGNMVKYTFYRSDGSELDYQVYEYDQNENMVEYKDYNSNGFVLFHYAYEYHQNGNMAKYIDYFSYEDVFYIQHQNEYDQNGNEVKSTGYDFDGSVTHCFESEYDQNGNMVKSTQYSYGDIYSYTLYEYDQVGNAIKYTTYYPDGRATQITDFIYNYEYDSQGNIIKATWYNWDNKLDRTNEYDVYGNLIKETHYKSDGNIDWSKEYDSQGNVISEYKKYDTWATISYYEDDYDYLNKKPRGDFRIETSGDTATVYTRDYANDKNRALYKYYVEEYQNGKIIKSTVFNRDGSQRGYLVFEYE